MHNAGSRKAEIQNNLEVMIDGFNQFNFEEKYKAIIPIYKEDDKYLIQDKIQKHKNITFANVESSEILKKPKRLLYVQALQPLKLF